MTDIRSAWEDVADNFQALLLKFKLHAEEELSEAELKEKAGFDQIRSAIEETFDAIQDAYEDEAVRDDAMNTGRAFLDALDTTVRDVVGRVTP